MYFSWFTLAYYVYWVILIYVTWQIINQYTISSRASAWLFAVYMFPVVGLVTYFIFGVKRRKRKIYQQKQSANQKARESRQQRFKKALERNHEDLQKFSALTAMVYRDTGNGITANNHLSLLENGEQKFPRLFADIEQAKHSIHLEYYIFRFDDVGSELVHRLIQKAKAGVAVRMIYDDYGCLGLNQAVLNRMRSHGIEVWPFAEINLFAFTERLNYRNHRKIVVIDNRIAYVGGINVGDEYKNDPNDHSSHSFWRDTHVRIVGPGVAYLQQIFLNDWNFCTEQDVPVTVDIPDESTELPQDDKGQLLQVIASGPDSPQPSILFAMLKAIHTAEEEILITTPYFIPNPSLMKALKIAVISGVSVKVLVPDASDNWVVNAAAQSFYYELLMAGVEFYKYTKGFIHAKTMVVDDYLTVMGTANFDERSFELNFEVNVLIFGERFASQVKQAFIQDIKAAKQLQVSSWERRSQLKKFLEKMARLIAPIL